MRAEDAYPQVVRVASLTEQWLRQKAVDLYAGGDPNERWAWVLVQEPQLVAFGVVTPERVVWPPDTRVDWARVFDLRIFRDTGEWHYWRDSHWQPRARLRLAAREADVWKEHPFLWGTRIDSDIMGWVKLVEERGAVLRLPLRQGTLRDDALPLRLGTQQVVDYEKETRLAGVVDAFLFQITDRSKRPLTPNLLRKEEQG